VSELPLSTCKKDRHGPVFLLGVIMKKLFVFMLLLVLFLGACNWLTERDTTGSVTIVITGLDELWWPNEIYMKGDIVRYDMWYESLQDDNIGHKPDISPEWWEVIK